MISSLISKTLLGFDFGLRHIGVAVGQTLINTARPLTVLKAQQGAPNWLEIEKLLEEWHPDALVIGVPLNMDGSTQPLTHAAKRFANRLQGRYKLPIYEIDERLSSIAARERLIENGKFNLNNKLLIHAVSAQIILESWMQDQLTSQVKDSE